MLDGRTTTVKVPKGVPLLDAAQRVRPDLPFACRGGVCGTCRARVIDWRGAHAPQLRTRTDELDAGFVLTCQALPCTPVTVDYDA